MYWLELCIYGFILGGLLMYALPNTFSPIESKDKDE